MSTDLEVSRQKCYLQRSCPNDYVRHVHHAFIIIFETRYTGLIKRARLSPYSLLTLSPFPLFPAPLAFAASFLPPVFISIFLNFFGYARGKYLVLQPRFIRLPRVRNSLWSHTAISRKVVGKNVHVIWDMCNTLFLTLKLSNLLLLLSFSTHRHMSVASRAILSNFFEKQ